MNRIDKVVVFKPLGQEFGMTIAPPLNGSPERALAARGSSTTAPCDISCGLNRQSRVSETGPCVGRDVLPVPSKGAL
jgi:hypothetical protein